MTWRWFCFTMGNYFAAGFSWDWCGFFCLDL